MDHEGTTGCSRIASARVLAFIELYKREGIPIYKGRSDWKVILVGSPTQPDTPFFASNLFQHLRDCTSVSSKIYTLAIFYVQISFNLLQIFK